MEKRNSKLELLSQSCDIVLMTNERHNPNYIAWAYCNFMRLSFSEADKERHLHLDKETHLHLEPIDEVGALVIIDQENQLGEIQNDDESRLYLEESRSQDTWNNGN